MTKVCDRKEWRPNATAKAVTGAMLFLALASGTARAENWHVEPSLTTRMIVTDNINYSATKAKSDQLLEVNPSISVRRTSPRLQFIGEYTPRYFHYAEDTFPSRLSHAFNLNGRLEVIDDFFFLDAKAISSEQNRSVFNAVPTDNASAANQLNRTRTYSLTPSLRGNVRLGDVALWSSSLNSVRSESSGTQGAISSDTFTAALVSTPAKIGWRVDASSVSTNSDRGGDSQRDRITGGLVFRPDSTLSLTARYGYENSDFPGAPKNSNNKDTYGGSVQWTPTPRTSLSADIDKRPYATTSTLNATHRLPRLVFNVSHSRNLTNRAQQALQPSGVFDLFDSLSLMEPFASIADTGQREQAMATYLRDNGLTRYVTGLSSILTDREFLQTRSQVSATYTGIRNTLSLSVFQTNNDSGVGSSGGIAKDDFSLARAIRQHGWSATYAYRLSAISSLSLNLSGSRSSGRTGGSLSSDRDTLNATWNTKLGARTNGSIGFRMTRATVRDGDVDENAVIATLTTRFN
ncbi:MAG TPA: TIGR03016 family PEP-CTERM system-associated outer membrane protein [Methyloversatilis sp.]